MSKLKPWKKLHSEYVLKHPFCTVRKDHVEVSNGTILQDYFLTELPEVALIFPITSTGTVLLVRQYKHGAEKVMLEFPGGVFNPGQETAEIAAKRELQEETGHGKGHWTLLGSFYENPTKTTNQIHGFLAEGIEQIDVQQLDDSEEIEIVEVHVTELEQLVRSGQLCASTSLALYLLYQTKNT